MDNVITFPSKQIKPDDETVFRQLAKDLLLAAEAIERTDILETEIRLHYCTELATLIKELENRINRGRSET